MKVILQLFAIAFVVVIASSCRDEFTEKDAIQLQSDAAAEAAQLDASLSLEQQREMELLRDSLARIGGIIQYTVSVVDAGDAVFFDGEGNNDRVKGTKAVSGATVTAAQNGAVFSVTTGADGLAVFPDMRVGNVAVNVAVTDFTDVNFVADLTPQDNSGYTDIDFENFTRNAATQVPVFPTTGANTTTISGRVTIETDLTNGSPEIPATNVIAVIDSDGDFIDKYILPLGDGADNENQAGRVLRISYSSAAVSAAVDATTGDYTLTVPASAMGLDMLIGTSDVIADQTLLEETMAADMQYVVGPQVHRAIFGEAVSASSIPDPSGAWVTFSAPTGATGQATVTTASASAVIGMSGTIALINVTNAGKAITQVPVVEIIGEGINAAGTAVVANGAVQSVTVDNAGQGYTQASTTVNLVFGGSEATLETTVLASVATVNSSDDPVVFSLGPVGGLGNDLVALPAPTFTENGDGTAGTGATAIAYGMLSNNTDVTAGGSGYVAKYFVDDDSDADNGISNDRISGPELVFGDPDFPVPDLSPAYYDEAEGYVKIQGAVTAVALSDDAATRGGDLYIMDSPTAPTLPQVIVTPLAGATTTVTMSTTAGEVEAVRLTDAGSGYTERPALTVSGNAIFRVLNMSVNAISNTSGSQYTFGDGVTATVDAPSLTGGTASATASLAGVVSSAWVNQLPTALVGFNPADLPVYTDNSGSGTTAAVLTGIVSTGGNLTGFTITNAGAGYTGDPTFQLTTGTDPVGIQGSIRAGFAVASVSVTSGGSGYISSADAAVTIGTTVSPRAAAAAQTNGFAFAAPTNATASSTLRVNAIEKISEGSGYNYTASNTATFSGGGTGATQATGVVIVKTSIASVAVATGGTYQTGSDVLGIRIEHNAPASIPTNYVSGDYVDYDNGATGPGDPTVDVDGQVWVTGSVWDLVLTETGAGFSTAPTMTADATDGGSGATFDVLLSDAAAFAWINAGGTGYVVQPGDQSQLEVDVNYNGESEELDLFDLGTTGGVTGQKWSDGLLALSIDDGGSGYTADPWVKIVDGTNEYFEDWTATASSGAVTALTAVNSTRMYDAYPTATIEIWKEAPGVDFELATSGVIAVNVDDPGAGYTVAPDVIFINDGTNGSGAAATANIVDGRVESITLTAAGSGYTSAPTVALQIPNTPYVAQGKVEVNEKGVVDGIKLYDLGILKDEAGNGYVEPPTVTISPSITGVGSGATAVATINSDGKVNGVIITNGGSGYFAKNSPSGMGLGWKIWPADAAITTYPSKAVVKDITMGTGYRD